MATAKEAIINKEVLITLEGAKSVKELERASPSSRSLLAPRTALTNKLSAYYELTKPRIMLMIVLTAAVGFVLAARHTARPLNYLLLFHTLLGIAVLASGVATLNQWMERELDGLMKRTVARPLPAGTLHAVEALAFGVGLILFAEIYLVAFVNNLTAMLGALVTFGYLLIYTPLKTRSSLSTVIGAVPGAAPPLLGWAAVENAVTLEALVLFAILFLWQFPHFLAIAWMYREDYAQAGIKMLPVVEPDGVVTLQQTIIYALLLIPVSLLPLMLGMGGAVYFAGASLLGAAYLWSSVRFAVSGDRQRARGVLLMSVVYLPLLILLLVIGK